MICLSIAVYVISFNNLLAIFCGMITVFDRTICSRCEVFPSGKDSLKCP